MSDTPAQMSKLLSAVAVLTDEVAALARQIETLEQKVNETKDIVEAWEAMKVGGRFVKWLAGIGSAVAGLWILTKAVAMNMFK